MFIDYLTMIMINLVAGSFLLAYYLWRGMDDADQRPYAAAFFGVGLLSLVAGLHLSFNWPLPGSYNVAYGDTTTLFGVVFLATAIALWQGWSLTPVAIYAFFAGIDAVIVGARILNLGLTKEPLVSAVGFIFAGLGGIGAAPFFLFFQKNRMVRMLGALMMLGVAVLWAVAFYNALWGHMEGFGKWLPPTMGGGGG
jgi:putative membrane protein